MAPSAAAEMRTADDGDTVRVHYKGRLKDGTSHSGSFKGPIRPLKGPIGNTDFTIFLGELVNIF